MPAMEAPLPETHEITVFMLTIMLRDINQNTHIDSLVECHVLELRQQTGE